MTDSTTTTDLIDAVSANVMLPRDHVAAVVNDMLAVTFRSLARGDAVKLRGLGTLQPIATKPRRYHHPKTGEPIDTPAGKRVRFAPSAKLREAMEAHR